MEITLTTPSIIFSAISLLLLAYTNRYLAVGSVIRALKKDQAAGIKHKNLNKQLDSLSKRLTIIRNMQMAGVGSMLAACVTMIFLYADLEGAGKVSLGVAIALVTISILLSLHETLLSNQAIQFEIDDLAKSQS